MKTVCESREGEVRAILTRDNLRAQPFDALQTRFIPKQEFVSQFKVQYLQNKNGSPQDLINIDVSNKDNCKQRNPHAGAAGRRRPTVTEQLCRAASPAPVHAPTGAHVISSISGPMGPLISRHSLTCLIPSW